MRAYVQGASALAHYRSYRARTEAERCSRSVLELSEATTSLKQMNDVGLIKLGIGDATKEHPLEVLVKESGQKTRAATVHARVWGRPIVGNAFRRVGPDVFVSSPEFVLLQMAPMLDFPELVALGMELCGTYRREVEVPVLGTNETKRVTEYQQPLLTSPRKIEAFLQGMKTSPGCSKARRALDYVLPLSASPMETAIYLLLCLPRRLGGYALPKPVLNPSITFSKSGKKHTLRNYAKPDLFWQAARLDLEYNSDEFHTEQQRALDSMRRKALERMGIEVIELTKEEVMSAELFHATAMRIARRLGRRIRADADGTFAAKRRALREQVLVSDESNAHDENATQDAKQDASEETYEYPSWLEEIMPEGGSFDESWVDEVAIEDAVDQRTADWDDGSAYVFGARAWRDEREETGEPETERQTNDGL